MRHITAKTSKPASANAQTRRLASLTLLCFLLGAFTPCQANSFLLVNSGSGKIYHQFKNRLSTTLKNINPNNTLTTLTLKNRNPHINNLISSNYDAVISAGIEASIAVSRNDIHTTIIMAMLPGQSYRKLSANGEISCLPRNCHVILLNQPIDRQLRLLKLALPDRKHIAVIGSENSRTLFNQLNQTAAKFGLTINSTIIPDASHLLAALNQTLPQSDVLMATPDPVIYNRNTARAILLTSFNDHIPLFAYSHSFVLAGATLGIYSTPEDIARHVANLLSRHSQLKKLPQVLYPKYFSVDVNRRAANALNIDIPDTKLLVQRLKAYEKK